MRKPKFKIGDIVKYNFGKKEYMIDDVKTYGKTGITYELVSESKPGITGKTHWQNEEKLELVSRLIED